MPITNLLGVDPGKMTGISYVRVPDNKSEIEVELLAELDLAATVQKVDEILGWYAPGDLTILMERFTVTAASIKKSFQPDSLWVIGAVKACMVLHGHDPSSMVMQAPSAAKGIASNDMLRDTGLWLKGSQGHAQDAGRHVLLYLLTHGWRPGSVLDAL